MKKLKVSEEFVVGKNKIAWVGSGFKEHLYPLSFTVSKETLKTKTLGKSMLDKEIFEEFKPVAVTLGDVLHFLKKANRDGWYIFYVNDLKGTLWAVHAHWFADDGGWDVGAYSVGLPTGWYDGHQVVSREFLDTEPQTLRYFEL